MENTVTYRLKNKRTIGSWTLKDGVAENNGFQERIHYRPGAKSIFDSENEKSPIKPAWVTFKYNNNPNDPACELIVPKSDRLLIKFLEAHRFYGKEYVRYSKEDTFKETEKKYSLVERALTLIREPDVDKLRAIAMTIYGMRFIDADKTECNAQLKEAAVKEPFKVIQAFDDENFESKNIVALAFSRRVIKMNANHTAIIWSNSDQKIINVAPGDSPIEKLAAFVRQSTQESVLLMRKIEEGLKEDMPENFIHDGLFTLEDVKERDAEIAELKKALAEKEALLAQKIDEESKKLVEELPEDIHPVDSLPLLTEKYVEKFGKEVPVSMKNNTDWIKKKLKEKEK